MPLVSISYHDNESLTGEEIVAAAVRNYGSNVNVDITPESSMPYDYIYFALQQLITHNQISLLYDRSGNYQKDITKLREKVLFKVSEILDQVIVDNESRIG